MNGHDDTQPIRFHIALRILHWLMAILVIAMLMIGVAMVSTSGPAYLALLALHRPIGLSLLALAIVRIVIRVLVGSPGLPTNLPRWQARAAHSSHLVLYIALIGLPLVGWAMLSAGGYPVYLSQTFVLPPIVPQDINLYGLLRSLHGWGAIAFLGIILIHITAALTHAVIRRDQVFDSMILGRRQPKQSPTKLPQPDLTAGPFEAARNHEELSPAKQPHI